MAPKRLHQRIFFLMWISLAAAVVFADLRQKGLWEAILLDSAIALLLWSQFARLRGPGSK
jgi:hypothetical protein